MYIRRRFTVWIGLFIVTLMTPSLSAGEPKLDCGLGAGEAPVFLEKLQVKASITGPLAYTSLTMTFRNPHNRPLGGDLYFPLPEGASVSGYALDINGILVDGVVVTKEKARVIFEKEMRRRVDPGLVEWTKGNNFKTRVFPIPAKGTRTVRVDYLNELENDRDGLVYRLPLAFKVKLADFSLNLEVDSGNTAPSVKQGPLEGVELAKWQQIYRAQIEKKDVLLNQDLLVALPAPTQQNVYVEEHNGEYFFLADLVAGAAFSEFNKKPSQRDTIALIWDASASRMGDHIKELQFLRDFLTSFAGINVSSDLERDISTRPGKKISLYLLRDTLTKDGEYALTDITAVDALIQKLQQISYDGGTSLGALQLPKGSNDCALLFSDGVSNWNGDTPTIEIPAYAISDTASTDFGALKSICRASGGQFFNLQTMEGYQQATQAILGAAPQLNVISVTSTGAAVYGVYPTVGDPVASNGKIRLVGRVTAGDAAITLRCGYTQDMAKNNTITFSTSKAIKGGLLRRYWAQRKLDDLLLNQKKNEQAITELGKQYAVVTPGTSLIVLENVNQYVEYGITPPATLPDMLKQYNEIMAQRATQGKQVEENKLNKVLGMWQQQVQWWERDYKPKDKNFLAKITGVLLRDREQPVPAMNDEDARLSVQDESESQREEFAAPALAAPAEAQASIARTYSRSDRFSVKTAEMGGTENESNNAPGNASSPQTVKSTVSSGANGSEAQPAKQIEVKDWDPKAPYLEALKEADATNRQQVYQAFRMQYGRTPAFFLDCANYFYRLGDTAFANRVLSNITELELENAALLRVAAYRLLDAKEYSLAIALLREVKRLRPEEPQSWRDLGLALFDVSQATKGNAAEQTATSLRESLELMKHVIMNNWDRFEGIEVIALTEFNRILPLAEKAGVKSAEIGLDPRLIKLLDMDIRVSMSWDADLTDIDLHVIEPSGEEVSYSHNLSATGGKVSRDFTQGYGPETYDLRRGAAGKYKIKANYYGSDRVRLLGPATLRLEIFTNYGRDNEVKQSVTLRLDQVKGMLDIAEIEQQQK